MIPLVKLVRPSIAFLMGIVVVTASPAGAIAQEQRSSPTSRSQDGGGGGGGEQDGPVAQVGAGTTDGSTTGYSGPENNVQAEPGENSLPPLPSADVCEPYRDTPAYEACLGVVLREKSGGTSDE